jgi:RNA polymerase sigma-70 factor (ECF subfamily)
MRGSILAQAAADEHTDFMATISGLLDTAYRAAYCLAAEASLAEELVEEAVRRASRRQNEFQARQETTHWFLRLLTRVCCERLGLPWPAPEPRGPIRQQARALAAPGTVALERIGLTSIERALDRLPSEDRVVTALYLVNDLSYCDLSEILEIPVESVRTRLHRGRRLLQETLCQRVA